jgi:hypothetical protein
LADRGIEPVIPPRSNRKTSIEYDREAYKRRNLIERCVNRLKQFRRIATRYEKNYPSLSLDAMYRGSETLDQNCQHGLVKLWPERHQRRIAWCSPAEAVQFVRTPNLRRIIRKFAKPPR